MGRLQSIFTVEMRMAQTGGERSCAADDVNCTVAEAHTEPSLGNCLWKTKHVSASLPDLLFFLIWATYHGLCSCNKVPR
jgi:hypothetical protein